MLCHINKLKMEWWHLTQHYGDHDFTIWMDPEKKYDHEMKVIQVRICNYCKLVEYRHVHRERENFGSMRDRY